MKIFLYYVGKARDTHANAMAEEYIKRSGRFATCEMREIHPARFDPWAKHPSARKILLDPAGKALDSKKLIAVFDRDMVFVIGGADGLPPAWKPKADLLISLSALTMPHELARVVLAEQIYRALTTLRGIPTRVSLRLVVNVSKYDALLIVSFGGPEKREDVIPFLENVLRGRNVPRERMLAVAEHYYYFDGRSPINDQNRVLIDALRSVVKIPVYWGNRNWHPMLADAMRQMSDDGIQRAVAFVTSAFGSYSGCRQYIEDIERARALVAAEGRDAAQTHKIRPFSEHPKFIEAMTDRVRTALKELPRGRLVFTAHSVPVSMAESSPYVRELSRACAAVAQGVGRDVFKLVYQSRSGPPTQPWLEPDIGDYLREIRSDVVIVPIGFLSDHMEVIYDLDTEARAVCKELGVKMVRAGTVGTHPAMIEMIAEMVEQDHASCPEGCCAAPQRQATRSPVLPK